MALIVIGTALVSFLATWLASKIFAGEQGTVVNTVVYYIVSAVVGFILGLSLQFLANMFPDGAVGITIVALIIGIVIGVMIPMHVYSVGVLRALGILVASSIFNIAISLVLVFGFFANEFHKAGFSLTFNERKPEGSIAMATPPPTPTPSATALAIQMNQMHTNLQWERAHLNANDPVAVTKFNQHVAEYNELRATAAATKR